MKKAMLNEIKSFSKSHFSVLFILLFWTQIITIFLSYAFKSSILSLHIIEYTLIFTSFMLFKDFVSDKSKKTQMVIFEVSTCLFIFALVSHFFISLSQKGTVDFSSAFRLSALINITVFLALFNYTRGDGYKKFKEEFYKNSLVERILAPSELNVGDVMLCKDKKTSKPVVLPFKDRFVHMLILGPTGSGKTSQTIIPLIHQDVQNKDAGITIIEPKGDLAEKIYAMGKYYNRPVMYFNPTDPDCPYFNPLYGKEDDVIENMATTFKMLNPDSPQFFQDMNENLLRNSLKVLKRLYGNNATLIDLARLVQNSGGTGRKIVQEFSKLSAETEALAKENTDIASWFLNDYFNERSKTYEHCSGLRSQVAKLISNNYLRRVLNPPDGKNDIDFDKHLEEGGIITITTAQGDLRDLGKYLGYFIILQLQSAVFRRPGNENTRRSHFLYIDEFQEFANPGFGIMLTQGRSYRIASHLATQNRALMAMGGGRDGKNFVELVSTNARNLVIYPGGNVNDAEYYSKQFGEVMEAVTQKGLTKPKFWILGGALKDVSESVRTSEQIKAKFSPSDIIYRPFGEIIHCIIKNNSIQMPEVGQIEFIPKEINDELDKMAEEYREVLKQKQAFSNTSKKEIEIEENLAQNEVPDIVGSIANQKDNIPIKPVELSGDDFENLDFSFFEDEKAIKEDEEDSKSDEKKKELDFTPVDDFI